MSNNLKLEVLLNGIDKLTAPFKNAVKESNKLAQSVKQTQNAIKALENTQGNISSFKGLKENMDKAKQSIHETKNKIGELQAKLATKTNFKETLEPQIRAVRKEHSLLSKELAKSKTINPALTQQVQKKREEMQRLELQYGKAKNDVRSLNSQIKKQNGVLQNSKNHFGQQSRAARDLAAKLRESGIKSKDFARNEQDMANKIKQSNQALTKQKAALDKVNAAQKRRAAYQEKVESLKSNSEKLRNIGQKSLIAGGAITATALKPVMEFAKAENAAINLKVAMMDKTGTVSSEFERINQLAMELGNRLPGTTSDFQNLMTMLVRQGISAESILGGTGQAAAYLSVQLGMIPEAASEFAAKMQDATRTTEKDMMGLMDIIQKGFYAGVDPTNMLGAYKNLGAAMDIIKMKGVEGATALAPLVAQLDQAGMEGSASGNALRKVFQKGMDTQKVKKALSDLKGDKLIPKNFNLDFTDGKGEFGGIKNLFKQLDKLKTLNTEARLAVIKQIFGDNAEVNQALTSIIEGGQEKYNEFAEKLNNQATLQERVNAQLKTLTNLWDAATGTLTNVLVSVGESISEELKEVVDWLGEVVEHTGKWVKENSKLVGSIMKWVGGIGAGLTVIGALSMALSFLLYPILRLILGLGHLTGTNKTLGKQFKVLSRGIRMTNGVWNKFAFAMKWGLRLILSPLKLIGLLFTPIGLALGALALAAIYIYNHWAKVKAFFGGFLEGLKTGLAPVMEKFKPLGKLFGWVADKVKAVFSWFGKLLKPSNETSESLDKAAKAGQSFGNALATAIEWALKPLTLLIDGVTWLIDNMPKFDKAASAAMSNKETMKYLGADPTGGMLGYARGGYTGDGYKYSPTGIVHAGEYVMTKEATSRIGVKNLNLLNYAKQGLGALALSAGVATSVAAQPFTIDNRPPLAAKPQAAQVHSPMTVNITINAAAGQSEQQIAQQVQRALENAERQRQAKLRSSLRDRD